MSAAMASHGLMPVTVPLQPGRFAAPGRLVHTPSRTRRCTFRLQPVRAVHLDPQPLIQLHDQAVDGLHGQLDHLFDHAVSLSLTLADAGAAVGSDPAAQSAAEVVEQGSKTGGFFGPIAALFENTLKLLDSGLATLHVPYSYGFAIILLTIIVKILTFPLTRKQVVSTMAMQKLQPKVKELQNRYKNDQEKAQLEVARLYREAQVNPLAGCLPTLATIPVFIGLYRALSNVAEEGLLSDGFFWIPSLGGPTTLAAQKAGGGFSWLLPFQDGAPPIGWADAIAYLSLPVLLVASQFISQKIISPPQSNDPSQQSSQWILKFLPFMIGYFALNVPSGLALYWFVNNILSTGQQAWLKTTYADASSLPGTSAMAAADKAEEERKERVKQLTGQQTNARRSKAQVEQRSGSGRKGEKFRALKAQEASRKAGAQGGNGTGQVNGSDAPPSEAKADKQESSQRSD